MKLALAQDYSGRDYHSTPLQPLSSPAWLSPRVWPFGTASLKADGAGIAVTDVGQGPILLFVHTGLWSFVWRDVFVRLRQDFRCVAFDAPGTGRSERLAPFAITLERASRALTAVVETLKLGEFTLVFHDLGGPSGLAGASRFSERVRGLVAVNTFGWKPSGAILRGMLALMGSASIREFDATTGLLARISSTAFGAGRHLDRESRAALRAGIGREGLRAFHRYMRDARRSDSIYEQVESALKGPFRTLPLLTIFGERNDPFGFQKRWKQMFPDARQLVVTKGNHFPMSDAPGLVAETIRSWHREHVR